PRWPGAHGGGGRYLRRAVERGRDLGRVAEVRKIPASFKLVSRTFHPHDTVITVGRCAIGSDQLALVAGPCSVEGEEQAFTIAAGLMSAEHIVSQGNAQVILCERGIRTFETYTRNTLDLNAIPVVKELSHLPVIVDPSHGTGIRNKVAPMARAAIAAGADGLMIEVHHDPDRALSDGAQSLYPEQYQE